MELIESQEVIQRIKSYPKNASEKLNGLRSLIFETAHDLEMVNKLVETTKWGEPSYVTKTGSTIRMDWKEKTPDKYYMYFICSTELVSNFKLIFGEELQFEDNRAIVLNIDEPIPTKAIKQCVTLALTYHKVKHLPMLGI